MNGIFNFFAMEDYFKRFRENIVGVDSEFESPMVKKILYMQTGQLVEDCTGQ